MTMTTARGARDYAAVDAVEGAGATFDGNHTGAVVSWLIGQGIEDGLRQDDLEILMNWVVQGHLAWVVIPN
jgi:hypothetical protein